MSGHGVWGREIVACMHVASHAAATTLPPHPPSSRPHAVHAAPCRSDLYVLNTKDLSWRRVVSPGAPLPRTSHQALIHRSYMYVFGGEFTSLNQQKFRHYGERMGAC
jgi:hypothetical protein